MGLIVEIGVEKSSKNGCGNSKMNYSFEHNYIKYNNMMNESFIIYHEDGDH